MFSDIWSIIILITTLIIFVGVGSADQSPTVEYTDKADYEPICFPPNCPSSGEYEVCGNEVSFSKQLTSSGGGFVYRASEIDTKGHEGSGWVGGEKTACDLGLNAGGPPGTSGGITVVPKGGMKPSKGKYIVVRQEQTAAYSDNLEEFFLTNDDGWSSKDEFPAVGGDDPALVLASEETSTPGIRGDEGLKVPKYGVPMKNHNSLNNYMLKRYEAGPTDWGCVDSAGGWSAITCEEMVNYVFDENLDGSIARMYDNSGTGDCDIERGSHNYDFSSCSPLHKDSGSYLFDGEVIVASEEDTSSFQSNKPYAIDENSYFYVCRNGYKGSNKDQSKVVKKQVSSSDPGVDYEWEYYRCDNSGDWVEIDCGPYQEVQQQSTSSGFSYTCQNIGTPPIKATFFNITEIPESANGTEFLGGFKLEEDEVKKLKTYSPENNPKIDYECWMGGPKDRDRTSSSWDNKNMFATTEINNFDRDHYFLGMIPWRSGVPITYSCVWGIREESSSEPDIYDSTNASEPKAYSEREVIKYSDLKAKTNPAPTIRGRDKDFWSSNYYKDERGLVSPLKLFMFNTAFLPVACDGTIGYPYC